MMYSKDELVFTEEDAVNAKNVMKVMLVRIFIEQELTYTDLHRRYYDYATSIGENNFKISSGWNNLIRALTKKKTITYTMLEFVLKNILRFNLTGMSMEFSNEHNVPYIVHVDRLTY